jgi:DNA repair ATPase RecN
MTSLKLDLEDQKDKLIRSDGRTKLLDKENIKLRQKLKEALKDLKRTMKEREKLLDLSNMLKSQLDKEPNTSIVAGEDTNLKIQAQVLQMQDKLREVTENNIALKNELIRLRDAANEDKEEVSNSKKLRDMRDSLVANGVSGKNITLSDREELKKKSLKQIQKKKDELVQTRKSLRDKL